MHDMKLVNAFILIACVVQGLILVGGGGGTGLAAFALSRFIPKWKGPIGPKVV